MRVTLIIDVFSNTRLLLVKIRCVLYGRRHISPVPSSLCSVCGLCPSWLGRLWTARNRRFCTCRTRPLSIAPNLTSRASHTAVAAGDGFLQRRCPTRRMGFRQRHGWKAVYCERKFERKEEGGPVTDLECFRRFYTLRSKKERKQDGGQYVARRGLGRELEASVPKDLARGASCSSWTGGACPVSIHIGSPSIRRDARTLHADVLEHLEGGTWDV